MFQATKKRAPWGAFGANGRPVLVGCGGLHCHSFAPAGGRLFWTETHVDSQQVIGVTNGTITLRSVCCLSIVFSWRYSRVGRVIPEEMEKSRGDLEKEQREKLRKKRRATLTLRRNRFQFHSDFTKCAAEMDGWLLYPNTLTLVPRTGPQQ